jgi:hypothetical protein
MINPLKHYMHPNEICRIEFPPYKEHIVCLYQKEQEVNAVKNIIA